MSNSNQNKPTKPTPQGESFTKGNNPKPQGTPPPNPRK